MDVEDYFHAESLRRFCPRSAWDSLEDRTVGNTRRVLDLLDETANRGTFFVLGWVAERHPDLVREIAARGHEVASHGFDHELIYRQSPDAFREDVRRARELLQRLSGQEVIGYRAPSYTIVERTLWALPILAGEGYLYDSSIFPIRRRKYGIPNAPRQPYRMTLGADTELVEFPLPTVRLPGMNLPATGGAYLRLLPLSLQEWAVRRHLQNRRALVLNVHPWEFDPGQPRLPVGLRVRWTHYHNLDRTESLTRKLLQISTSQTQTDVLRELDLLP